MGVVSFDIARRSEFGKFDAGEYQQLDGTVTFAVDPSNAANRNIVDLGLAPRNDQGHVEFTSDFSLVTPTDAARGNHRLIVDIPNRGSKLTAEHSHRAAAVTPEDRDRPGDGFLCHRGFSFLSIGWQWDAQVEGGLNLNAPEATDNGDPLEGNVLMKLQPDQDRPHLALIQLGQTRPPYPVHDPASSSHRLYERNGASATLVDRSLWRFARSGESGVEASDQHVYLEGGFKRGITYELVYRTRGAPVVGTGLLAIRDIAACLRYADEASPVGRGFTHVFAFGVSQTGRVPRHLLYEGLNRDENKRVAYDGMLIHIAGGQRGDFNHRFAQPTLANVPGLGQRFPFAASTTRDPISKREDGLFARLDEAAIPKVMFANTSWEYWRGDASLIHIQEDRDLEEHPSTRIYHIAGTHHIGGILVNGKQVSQLPTGLVTSMPLNVVNAAPVFRALFTALDQWVSEGKTPPDSRHPRLDDNSAARRERVLGRFAEQTDVPTLSSDKLITMHDMDFGPLEAEGVAEQPVIENEAHQAYVSAINDDLNEIAGIHVPDIACPLGYHTGWNPRSEAIGAADELATFAGFSVFFPKHEIISRYTDEEGYLARASKCIEDLVAAGFVLEQDRDWMMSIARSRFRAAVEAD